MILSFYASSYIQEISNKLSEWLYWVILIIIIVVCILHLLLSIIDNNKKQIIADAIIVEEENIMIINTKTYGNINNENLFFQYRTFRNVEIEK